MNNKSESNSDAKVVYYYGSLFKVIDKLGSEIKFRNLGWGLLFFVLTIVFFSLYGLCSLVGNFYDGGRKVFFTLGLIFLILGGVFLIAFLFYARKKRPKIEEMNNAIDNRKVQIYFILYAFLVSPSSIYSRNLDINDFDFMKKRIHEIESNNDISSVDVEFLIDKISGEKKEVEKKRRITALVLFAVALVSAGLDFIKSFMAYYLWDSYPTNSDEALKSLITMISSAFALFVFVLCIYTFDTIKSCYCDIERGVLIRNDYHIRNMEYTILALKDIRKRLEDKNIKPMENGISEEVVSLETSLKNEIVDPHIENDSDLEKISESLSGIENEFKELNQNFKKTRKIRVIKR